LVLFGSFPFSLLLFELLEGPIEVARDALLVEREVAQRLGVRFEGQAGAQRSSGC